MISRISQWYSQITTMNNALILLVTIATIILAILWYNNNNKQPPGPRGLPIVGYLPFIDPNLHIGFTKMAQRYGPIFKLNLGSKTLVVVSSSELAKVVTREQDEIFANRDPTVAGLTATYGGQDIVWSDNNSYWRNLRKVFVSEVMSNKSIEATGSFRRGGIRKTIKHVYESMGSEVDIGGLAFLTSLSVLTSMTWGKSLVEDETISSSFGVEFREVISKIVELLGTANVSDLFPVLSRLDLQGVNREMKRQRKKVDEILDKIIDERIATKPEEAGVDQQLERKDFLQILLELKDENTTKSFSITQIKALFMDILTGGTDTTSTIVEWTMAELLQNPNIMQKVKEEVEEVVGANNIVDESHLPQLKYLDAVVKETFRLHPPLPLLITRCPNQSCKVGGYTVQKGSNVYINVWAIHRDPQYWENPLEFNPNRFRSPDGTSLFDYNGYNFNFIPFGSGRRRCPGIPLGVKMVVYLLASMLHSFNWTLPNGKEHELSDTFGIVLKKRNPLIAIPSQRLPNEALYM